VGSVSNCKNCGEQVQQGPKQIPTHANGIVYCGFVNAPIDWYDRNVAQLADGASRG
jgi:hypothetical protein